MTIRQNLEKFCVDNGMFESEAKATVELYEKDDRALAECINNDAEGYPDIMFAVLYMGVKRYALQYIDANTPLHWARPMFL